MRDESLGSVKHYSDVTLFDEPTRAGDIINIAYQTE